MANRKPLSALTGTLAPERRSAIETRKAELRAEMSLAELRAARHFTQETLGETLSVGQPAIAKIEKRTDMYVGNLRRFINAMGGELEITAHFTDGDVVITNFADIDDDDRSRNGAAPVPRPVVRA
ncbi:DNA-binding XRE family transcriptional regulator [Sphingomonas sp. UYAg733]